jgi:site-specific DNA recombinase
MHTLKEEIDASDFREIKAESEKRITILEIQLMELSQSTSNIKPMLEKAITALSRLDQLYMDADTKKKRLIIGSIFPEKLVFDGFQYRTARVNEVVHLIYMMDKGLLENKNGQTDPKIDLSTFVTRPGFEPRQAEPESAVLPLYYRAISKKN